MVDAAERLEVLLRQEHNHYLTCDYLSRMHANRVSGDCELSPSSTKKRNAWPSSGEGKDECSPGTRGSEFNGGCDESATTHMSKQWREKICEWAYQGM